MNDARGRSRANAAFFFVASSFARENERDRPDRARNEMR